MIQHFNLFDGEEDYVNEMIKKNPMNNSIWSYRYFILAKTKDFTKELVENEVNFAFDTLNEFKLDNEGVWVYLRGYLARSKQEAERSLGSNSSVKRMLISEFPFIKEKCEQMLKDNIEGSSGYRFILTLLLDFQIAENDIEKAVET